MEAGDNKTLYGIIIALVIVIVIIYFASKSEEKTETKITKRISDSDISRNLYVSDSKINGEGLFTNSDISNGKRITEVGDLDKWQKGVEFQNGIMQESKSSKKRKYKSRKQLTF